MHMAVTLPLVWYQSKTSKVQSCLLNLFPVSVAFWFARSLHWFMFSLIHIFLAWLLASDSHPRGRSDFLLFFFPPLFIFILYQPYQQTIIPSRYFIIYSQLRIFRSSVSTYLYCEYWKSKEVNWTKTNLSSIVLGSHIFIYSYPHSIQKSQGNR